MGGYNTNNILLINLPIQTYLQKDFSSDTQYNPSLGLISLGTWLELNGYLATVIDLCYHRMPFKEVIDNIEQLQPILIGISVYTENIDLAKLFAEKIKSVYPHVPIVLGGPHPTLVPEDGMESQYVDYIIRKEGESTMLELVEAIESNEYLIKLDDIDGLVFKRDGRIIKNKIRKQCADLDIAPLVKRDLVDLSKYKEIINIFTSRGCPGRCIYCSATTLSGATYRVRNIENVFMEIVMMRALLNTKVMKIYIVDDTFTAIPDRVKKFTELMSEYDPDIYWHCESRIDVMSEELLNLMSENKCIAIQYGIESASQEVLDSIRKGINLTKARKIIDYTYKKKIFLCLSFMVGHFCDTKDTMEETYLFIKEMYEKYRAEIALSFNTPFPGTWQHTHKDELGLEITADRYKQYSLLDPIVKTDNFTVNDQREIFYKSSKYLARAVKIESLKREWVK